MRVIVGSAQVANAMRNFLICRAAADDPYPISTTARKSYGLHLALRDTHLLLWLITSLEVIE